MLLALAVSLLVTHVDPPIRIKLSDDVFARGDRVRLRVKTLESGYLLVLRADSEGRIRVHFPIDPSDSGAVRGGKEVEVRGRGDREAFTVDDREGSGKVLAARSSQPFRFDAFSRAGHWDYAALAAHDSSRDAEAALLALVDRMAVDRYDYDLVTYTVGARRMHPAYVGWGRMGGWGGWGRPWRRWGRGGWYDPFWSFPYIVRLRW